MFEEQTYEHQYQAQWERRKLKLAVGYWSMHALLGIIGLSGAAGSIGYFAAIGGLHAYQIGMLIYAVSMFTVSAIASNSLRRNALKKLRGPEFCGVTLPVNTSPEVKLNDYANVHRLDAIEEEFCSTRSMKEISDTFFKMEVEPYLDGHVTPDYRGTVDPMDAVSDAVSDHDHDLV